VVTWEGGEATLRCVDSLCAQRPALAAVIVVDNASGARERERLTRAVASRPGVQLLLLPENRQFAGGMNAGAAAASAAGAERVLLLNNDTVLAPDALSALGAALDGDPGAGIVGPLVRDLASDAVLSAGEHHSIGLLCIPRTLLRPRRYGAVPYRVTGVMGCALLVTRACFEAVGGFSEAIAVYYEDVDFCLGAGARGYRALIAPGAVIRHDGIRGFAAGLTPWAARLKARNPWLVMQRHGGVMGWLAFLPSYVAMIATSMLGYAARGRMDIVRALGRGAFEGVRCAAGAPSATVAAPAGRG
jgi:GT2 family glycosyltransferase